MFGAVLGLLAELAAQAPVLLILEDLHWADASTRDLLTFLSRMLHRERVAIVGTYRTDDLHRRHPLRAVVADLLRLPSVTHVRAADRCRPPRWQSILPPCHDGPATLPAATLNRIVERAEGNPYYAEELLRRRLATPGALARFPPGLAALLLSRVERVSDAAQQVLRAAAVAGRRADDDLVRALARDVSGLADPDYDAGGPGAVAHQLLVPDEAATAGYAFRHALLREAVYSDLLPGERTRLHARIAALLAARRGRARDGGRARPPQPGQPRHPRRARGVGPRGGARRQRLGAPAEAHRHYDQALALWDRVARRREAGRHDARHAGPAGPRWRPARAATCRARCALLRRIRSCARRRGPKADPELRSRAGERLAYFLHPAGDP